MIKGTSKRNSHRHGRKIHADDPQYGQGRRHLDLLRRYEDPRNRNHHSKTIKIKLESDTEIGEVVVTGYGVVQRREDLVGSAYQVSSKSVELMPVSRG